MFFDEKSETAVNLHGPAGLLESKIVSVDGIQHERTVAIICHPHPQFGGTMENKVVTTLARTFRDLGVPSVRFNFRGVGRSEGDFDNTVGETEDLLAIVNWVIEQEPNAKLWIAGFSFGSYVALDAVLKLGAQYVEQLILVAPAVPKYDANKCLPQGVPVLIIQGDKDEVIAPEDVYAWLHWQTAEYELVRLAEAGHFFHGMLVDMKHQLIASLKNVHAYLSSPK